MALITELPIEILVWIFRELRDMHVQWCLLGWLPVTHVCREWRHVALDAAELWTQIYSFDPDCVRAFLTRSKNTPLDIFYPLQTYQDRGLDAIIPMLLSQSARFRRVDLGHSGVAHTFLEHPFPRSPPLLSDLHLCYVFLSETRTHPPLHTHVTALADVMPRICDHGLPALRRLRLDHWPVANLASIRGLLNPSLRVLEIVKPHARHPARAWADILTSLPLLEELTLDNVLTLRNPRLLPTAGHETLPLIRLPRLSSLRLCGYNPLDQLSLLRQIRASSDVHITFSADHGSTRLARPELLFEQYVDILRVLGQKFAQEQHTASSCPTSVDLRLVSGAVAAYASDDFGATSAHTTSRSLNVTLSAVPDDIHNSDIYCSKRCSNGDAAPILMLHLQGLNVPRQDLSTPLCDMLLTTFSWSTLRTLHLAPSHGIPTDKQNMAAFVACKGLFLQMTNLRVLSVVTSLLDRSLFALFGVIDPSAAPGVDDGTGGAAQVPFPALEVLTIQAQHRWEMMGYGPLRRVLLSRKAAGYPVPRVHICLSGERRTPGRADPGDLVAGLRAAVGPLACGGCSVDFCTEDGDGDWCIQELVSAE